MINVEYRWRNQNNSIVSRTIKQITVPRIDEVVNFRGKGREATGIVVAVGWVVTETESNAYVALRAVWPMPASIYELMKPV